MDPKIIVITEPIELTKLQALAEQGFGDMVKGVVDLEKSIMALNGDLHADEEAVLLEAGSKQTDLWGINLYPAEYGQAGWLEFDSMINIRPHQHNRSRSVEDPNLRESIRLLVDALVKV